MDHDRDATGTASKASPPDHIGPPCPFWCVAGEHEEGDPDGPLFGYVRHRRVVASTGDIRVEIRSCDAPPPDGPDDAPVIAALGLPDVLTPGQATWLAGALTEAVGVLA